MWCQTCKICESYKLGHKPKKAPLKQQLVGAPLERIACDIVGPVVTSKNGNCYILVVADYFTKFVEAFPLPDQTAQTVADILVTQWVCRYGVPLVIHTDQGRNYESLLFKEMCKLLDISKTRTSRYRPQSDGLVERMNRTLRQMLRAVVSEFGSDWDDHLPYILLAYRSTVHDSVNFTPNFLMFGREVRVPVDIMYGDRQSASGVPTCPIEYVEWVRNVMQNSYKIARENLEKSAIRQKRGYDVNTKTRSFKRGDWVWVFYPPSDKDKFGRGWKGPYLVVSRLGEVNYRVQKDETSQPITVHVDHIKAYTHEDIPEVWISSSANDKAIQVG